MARPLCLLFDCDGTLVDSEPLLASEMSSSLTEAGLPFRPSDYMGEFRGARFRRIVAALEQRYGSVDPERLDALEARMRANLNRRLASELIAIDGAAEALAALTGHPMGVVSNGPENKIRTSLDATGLSAVFGDRLFSAYTAQCWKPDPCLFHHAASRMGFASEDCVVIDDAMVGVRGALAAGMTVIHLNRFPDVEETPAGAIMISNMFQLPTVIAHLETSRALAAHA
ncbi:HAD family hydrolase [Halomonas saccharevitans]|uniref:Haloacid dehalogenase superfamily, subfamily IA, variant 3 with third motif having DD or ED n=1 Tax=Halomonas saccharevitans TaxID=416872 RepID=A0A1I6XHK6_9GAMM|nr:HAD-IA family hydrolase [Halomonas saccharevitans]SFT37825.1 haloacid dehalogenase superfamily, subfamily IA, variant 3 with third motif having DD or ED [Halomonas saccharevitans]